MPVASELVAVVLLCAVASSATSVPVGDEKTVADVCDCGYGTHYGMAAGFECTCGSEADEDCCGLGVSCYDYCSDYTVGGVVNRKKLDDGRVIFKAKLKDSRWDDITKPGGGDEDRWVDKKTGKIEQRLIERFKEQMQKKKKGGGKAKEPAAAAAAGGGDGLIKQPLKLYDDNTGPKIMEHAVKTHFLLFCSKESADYPTLITSFHAAAKASNADWQNKNILHVVMPIEEASTHGVQTFFGVDNRVASGEDEFPLALIVETHKGMKSFFSSTFSPGADLSKPGVLAAFEEAFWSGAARPNLKTAVVVNQAKADGTVYEMVGSEFGDLVLRSDKDVLLFFYAPWCGGCKQFKPKYEAAAVELSDQNTLLVARMDATQNQVDHKDVNIASYPYLVGFAADKSRALSPPTGTTEVLVDWVKQNFRHTSQKAEL